MKIKSAIGNPKKFFGNKQDKKKPRFRGASFSSYINCADYRLLKICAINPLAICTM